MSKEKTQRIDITFERNGADWGFTNKGDILHHSFDYILPDDFNTGVHIIGAKTGNTINYNDENSGGSETTGYDIGAVNIITDRDIEKMVGKILTIVDATISDKDQKTAFKSLIKQTVYGQYNDIVERSAEHVNARPYKLVSEI